MAVHHRTPLSLVTVFWNEVSNHTLAENRQEVCMSERQA